jgi:hypothetical protein
VFCNKVGRRAREDIVSKWIAEALRPDEEGAVWVETTRYNRDEHLGSRLNKWGDFATYKAKNVCKKCNGVWMSQLDNAAKGLLLTPLLHGTETVFDAHQQATIENWAVLKALAFDEFHGRLIALDKFHAFYADRGNPPNRTVYLGAYDGPDAGVWQPSTHRQLHFHDATSDVLVGDAVHVAINFKHLVVVVYIYGDDWPIQPLAPSDDSYLVRVGEHAPGEIQWPPRAVMDRDAVCRIMAIPTEAVVKSAKEAMERHGRQPLHRSPPKG